MADQNVTGSNWSDDELDAIVADHFAMLRAQSEGQPYVKAQHGEVVRHDGVKLIVRPVAACDVLIRQCVVPRQLKVAGWGWV